MIINQGPTVTDVHCDGCPECQTFEGVYRKLQLNNAAKEYGWHFKWDPDEWRHYCKNCWSKHLVLERRKEDEKEKWELIELIKNLEFMANPKEKVFLNDLLVPEGYWEGIIKQAIEIIKKEKIE